MIIGSSEKTDDRDVKRFLYFFTEIDTLKIDNFFEEEKI